MTGEPNAVWYYRVVQLSDETWSCRHGLRTFDSHNHLDEALAHITEIAAAHPPAEVFVHTHNGFVQRIKSPLPRLAMNPSGKNESVPNNASAEVEAVGVVLLVDVANVVGSRPDGWWHDRAGAASRLLALLAGLPGTTVTHPGDVGAVRLVEVLAVVEGAARSATAANGVAVVAADRDGDGEIVAQASRIVAENKIPLVVTADRGLRARLPYGSEVAGPGWLNRLIGR